MSQPGEQTKPYAVRALLIQEGKILFIHHKFRDKAMFNKWTFPGGRLDEDEADPIAALHREMREELSLDIEVFGKIGVFYSRAKLDYTIYGARPLGPIGPVKGDEIHDFIWLTPAEVYEWHTKERLQFGFEMDVVSSFLRSFPEISGISG
jgi:8-oxo-dGTP pyrophosphatase MutT (NUDIX family)